MPSRKRPRRGSLQYYPRKRSRRIYPRINFSEEMKEGLKEVKPLTFVGYKAGMTHVQITKGNKIESIPVTVIDAPPVFVCGLRFYGKDTSGFKPLGEIWAKNIPKDLEIERRIGKGKKKKEFEFEKNKDRVVEIRLIVCTQPKKSGIHKKKPELFEIALGGSVEEQYKYGADKIGKELKPEEVFRVGEYCDVTAVTKGHGYTGSVKRFGIKIQGRKDEQHHRHPGSIGSTIPRKIDWRVPLPGQCGFFQRTEYNKHIIMINEDAKKVNPVSGFVNYGLVKGSFILVEGSVPGPKKRLIFLRRPLRTKKYEPIEVKYISQKSQQG
ncbi:MAG: 50S ribosomal protein L3 [Candidatus Aenigmarchaeota archaeon]|nr:50S ribosomal protein L3 [Candidatus Aenigmarchaeota archaeon]